jgi:hypothetical protein
MLNEIEEVNKYIELCHNKSKHHYKNSLNSRKWDNILNFTSVLIVATTSLTMPLLAINGETAINVAISGNTFAFLGVIVNALKTNYGFITLIYQHSHLSSEFNELESDFRNFQRKTYDNDELEKLILKFQAVNSRSNIQNVKDCHFCCCFI